MKNNKITSCIIKTKIGNFQIIIDNGYLTKAYPCNLKENIFSDSELIFIKNDINKYLDGKKKTFSMKVKPEGSKFQKIVWKEIKKIKYEKTKSYLELAKKLGTSPRAIGNACSKNKCLLFIPCHRVIRTDKTLGGFLMGENIKKKLLTLEKGF